MLPHEYKIYTVLDLKDVFLFIPLSKLSHPIFAFEGINLDLEILGQLNQNLITSVVQEFSYHL